MSMKKHGPFCIINGCYRANERFSGKGHIPHICKQCAKLPAEKRSVLQTLNRIENLPFYLSRDQRSWLEKMRKDKREEVRTAAEMAYEMRFARQEESDEDVNEDLEDLVELLELDAVDHTGYEDTLDDLSENDLPF